MSNSPLCPACQSMHSYADRGLLVCVECAHEWDAADLTGDKNADNSASDATLQIRDANGNILSEGDSVTVIKDLKVKGSSSSVKVGTKVRNIHLTDGEDGHNISCKIDGFGAMNLKSEFVKKA